MQRPAKHDSDEISLSHNVTKAQQSRWLRRSRRAPGLDVRILAQELNVSPRTINAWENESNVNLPSREKLFQYLILLFGKRGLSNPALLIQISKEPGVVERRLSSMSLSGMFVRLTRKNQLLVNIMIRTLYQTERLIREEKRREEKRREEKRRE